MGVGLRSAFSLRFCQKKAPAVAGAFLCFLLEFLRVVLEMWWESGGVFMVKLWWVRGKRWFIDCLCMVG